MYRIGLSLLVEIFLEKNLKKYIIIKLLAFSLHLEFKTTKNNQTSKSVNIFSLDTIIQCYILCTDYCNNCIIVCMSIMAFRV